MPRPDPFTAADIKKRDRLTGLSQIADPSKPTHPVEGGITPVMRHLARNWNFSPAMDTLNVPHKTDRERCNDELILICVINKLERLVEMQETPGRKARAFQLAPRWQKARMQEWRKIEGTDEKLAGQALRRWQKLPWLPQSLEQEAVRELRKSLEQEAVRELGKSLEQEAVRELGYIPNTRQDFARPRKRMTQLARRGKYKSWALRNTMHALQVCAAGWNDNLTWREGKAPPQRLIRFLTRVLSAAEINYPNPETNYSKFTALMLRPKKETGEQPSEKPPDPWRPLKDARDAASAYAETPEGKTRLERAEELFRQWFERDGVPVSGVTTTRAVVITGGFSRVIRPPRRAV